MRCEQSQRRPLCTARLARSKVAGSISNSVRDVPRFSDLRRFRRASKKFRDVAARVGASILGTASDRHHGTAPSPVDERTQAFLAADGAPAGLRQADATNAADEEATRINSWLCGMGHAYRPFRTCAAPIGGGWHPSAWRRLQGAAEGQRSGLLIAPSHAPAPAPPLRDQ